jgi:hypothetical protein
VQVINCDGLTIEAQGCLAEAAAKRVEILFNYDNGSKARWVGPVTVGEIEDTLSPLTLDTLGPVTLDELCAVWKRLGVHTLDTYPRKRTEAQWKTERRRFTR